jgi:hypothetical protein
MNDLVDVDEWARRFSSGDRCDPIIDRRQWQHGTLQGGAGVINRMINHEQGYI